MFTATSQTAGGEKRGQNPSFITISSHAQNRWTDRTQAEISVKEAWEQSVPVEAPEADSTATRLYPPYNALLVVKHATMTTVLSNDGRLDTSGLIDCPSCGDLVDPVDDDTCPWCGAECVEEVRPGCVTLTQGGF
jgi:hypothetical protein